MPSSFTRWGEKLRQRLSPQESSNEWRPTSNARNQSMIEETRAFAQHVKLLLRELDDTNDGLMARVEASLATMGTVLTASPPQAFDETGAPVDSGEQIGGMAVNHTALVSAGQEMRQRLTDEVILPLQQWLEAFRGIKARNKKLEEVRLDLDTKRREMMQLQERYAKLQGQGHKDSDNLQYKAKSKEFKMGYLASQYRESEAEVFNALLDLNSDTAMLRNYQAAAIAIMQRCFTTAHAAFNTQATVLESGGCCSNAAGPESTIRSSLSNIHSISGHRSQSNRAETMSKDTSQPDLQSSSFRSNSESISECHSQSYPQGAMCNFNEQFEDLSTDDQIVFMYSDVPPSISSESETEALPATAVHSHTCLTLPNASAELAQGAASMTSNSEVASGSSATHRPAAKRWFAEATASAKRAGTAEQPSNCPPLVYSSAQAAAASPAALDTPFLSPNVATQALQQQLSQAVSPAAPTSGQLCPSQTSGSWPSAPAPSPCAPGSFPIACGFSRHSSGSFSTACGTPPEAPSSPHGTPGCSSHAPGALPTAPGFVLDASGGCLPKASGSLPCAPGCSGHATPTLSKASGFVLDASGGCLPKASGSMPRASGCSGHAPGTLPNAPGFVPDASGAGLPKASRTLPRTSGSTNDSRPTTLASGRRTTGALPNTSGFVLDASGGCLPKASGSTPCSSGSTSDSRPTMLASQRRTSGALPKASGFVPDASGGCLPKASGSTPCAPGSTLDSRPTTLASGRRISGALPKASGFVPDASGGCLPKASSSTPRASDSTSDSWPTTLTSGHRASGSGSSLLLESGSARTTPGSLPPVSASLDASSSLLAMSGEFAQAIAPMAPIPRDAPMSYAASRPPVPSWSTEAKASVKRAGQDRESGQGYPMIPSATGKFAQGIAPMAPSPRVPIMRSAVARPTAPTSGHRFVTPESSCFGGTAVVTDSFRNPASSFVEAKESADYEGQDVADHEGQYTKNADGDGQDNNSGSMDATDNLDIAARSPGVQRLERTEIFSAPDPLLPCPEPAAPVAVAVGERKRDKIGRLACGFLKSGIQVGAAAVRLAEGFNALAEGYDNLAGGEEEEEE